MMSKSVDLSASVHDALEEAATASGTTPEEWIAAHLPATEPVSDKPSRLLAERFEGYLGLVSLERTDLAARASELFAEGMEEKYREGRL
jgi:hypothetical protein